MADELLPTNNMGNYANILTGAQRGLLPNPAPTSSIDQLMAMISKQQPTMGDKIADVGSTIGAFSQGQKANRLAEGDMRQGFDKMMLDREQNMNRLGIDAQDARNTNEADAMQKLQQTSYLMGGGHPFTPPTISLGGIQRQVPNVGFGPTAPSDAEKAGAEALQGQLMGRLSPGGSFTPSQTYQPTPVEEYAKPGGLEKATSYLGAGTGIAGMIGNLFGGPAGEGGGTAGGVMNLASKIPGLGNKLSSFLGGSGTASGAATGASAAGNLMSKAVPIAGAITGGMGLIHNQGIGKNMMNGVTAGASIGSMVPGLGTAVGAGIGAGVGALRSLGSIGQPSQQELEGRNTAGQVRQSISSGASPQQVAEAQKSGWKKPEDALTLIVLRDKLASQGGNPDQANQLATQLWQAEKGGPHAVEQAVLNIQKALTPHA